MKKLMIVMIALVVVALCFVTYASNQDQWLGRENNRVTPVDTYELEYVYHRALYTSSLMDYREPYGVQSADEFDIVPKKEFDNDILCISFQVLCKKHHFPDPAPFQLMFCSLHDI